mmetsp:Transcript_20814/g.14930  ORF Transcript_20814/g.14930 Transcript_20814/m.14930 type:complete len:115 (+) Transcript_20814:424-768(+)
MHRDMKPANILLDDKMNIKVIDFGEAKQYGEEDPVDSPTGPDDQEVQGFKDALSNGKQMSRKGTFVGTLNYLAPEMIKENESGFGTDLWALGCILFKMLTGHVPFPGIKQDVVF